MQCRVICSICTICSIDYVLDRSSRRIHAFVRTLKPSSPPRRYSADGSQLGEPGISRPYLVNVLRTVKKKKKNLELLCKTKQIVGPLINFLKSSHRSRSVRLNKLPFQSHDGTGPETDTMQLVVTVLHIV